MNSDNRETWHAHPLAIRFASSPMGILSIVAAVFVTWLVVMWWTEWRWRR
jgi:hypothetical protein